MENVEFTESMIIEFNQLNIVLKKMIQRILKDFTDLKEFTGDISHEIQTPLAVVKSKAELLLQTENLTEKQNQLIIEILEGTTSLSNLNKTLILLTKIEHHQFPQIQDIEFEKRIIFHLSNFQDYIDSKQLTVTSKFSESVKLKMNPELADILIINLLKNAIRHNITSGTINIELSSKSLVISNSGAELNENTEKLFQRFTKASKINDSLGLGLALVKKICESYNFKVSYDYKDQLHTLSVKFEE
jgi:signal transduction histidine kinase